MSELHIRSQCLYWAWRKKKKKSVLISHSRLEFQAFSLCPLWIHTLAPSFFHKFATQVSLQSKLKPSENSDLSLTRSIIFSIMPFYFSQRAMTSLNFKVHTLRERACLNNQRKKLPKLNIPSCLLEDCLNLAMWSRNLRKSITVISHGDVSLWQLLLANRTKRCLNPKWQNAHGITHYWVAWQNP